MGNNELIKGLEAEIKKLERDRSRNWKARFPKVEALRRKIGLLREADKEAKEADHDH
jgi:hypothetical protein